MTENVLFIVFLSLFAKLFNAESFVTTQIAEDCRNRNGRGRILSLSSFPNQVYAFIMPLFSRLSSLCRYRKRGYDLVTEQ